MAFKNIEEWAGDGHRTVGVTVATGEVLGVFHPGTPNRYGLPAGAGSTSGERGSLEALQAVIRSDSNPFEIADNKSYVATITDLKDTQFLDGGVKDAAGRTLSVYDVMVPDDAAPATTPPRPPATPGQPGTPGPFQPMSDRQILELMALGINRIEAALTAKPAALGPSDPLAALKTLKRRAALIEANTQFAKHHRYDELMAEVVKAVAEGGA